MDDTLPPVGHAKVRQPERLHVLFQGRALRARVRLRDELFDGREVLAGCGPARVKQ